MYTIPTAIQAFTLAGWNIAISDIFQNRGIGLAICQKLATGYAGPLIVYAASRAGAPISLSPAAAPSVKFLPARISLTDNTSIDALATRVRDEQGGCDVLINNAGLYYYWEDITPEQRKETLDVNTRGTIKVVSHISSILFEARLQHSNPHHRCAKHFCH